MCIICVELEKGALTPWEAARNLGEMSESMDKAHVLEALLLTREHQKMELCEWCDCDPCDCDDGEQFQFLGSV